MKSWVKILIGLFAGTALGLLAKDKASSLWLVGKIFIDLLKMLVGILIFSSIVTGICHIHDPKRLGRIGLRSLIFFILTTIVAISTGIITTHYMGPGNQLELMADASFIKSAETLGIYDFIKSIVPVNPFASFVDGNILQIIIFAVFFSLAIVFSGEKGKPVLSFFESLAEIMNTLSGLIMQLAPYGVFALIASAVGSMGVKIISPLLQFLFCCYFACAVQLFIVFAFILRFLVKISVVWFFKGMKDAIVLAFTTSSSAATLPVTMECVTTKLGVSKDLSGFVLSLGSTVNMNGAAIGQAVSALFIAQAYGIELTWVNIFVLIFTALFTAIGAAGVPGQGIVMLSVVLSSIGLPLEGIALVAGVDQLREMVSTVVNVLGDAVAAVYIAKKEGEFELKGAKLSLQS
jgi:DAACS family dicarboxylate/amino acid:cation (Na+ or H+) symporter